MGHMERPQVLMVRKIREREAMLAVCVATLHGHVTDNLQHNRVILSCSCSS